MSVAQRAGHLFSEGIERLRRLSVRVRTPPSSVLRTRSLIGPVNRPGRFLEEGAHPLALVVGGEQKVEELALELEAGRSTPPPFA